MNCINQQYRLFAITFLSVCSILLSSCKNDPDPVVAPNTITDIVLTNNQFTFLRAAVVKAGLGDALRGANLTVFAPNDDAFKASGYPTIASVEALPAATLRDVLLYHVLPARTSAASIPTAANTAVQSLLTTNGTLYVTKSGSNVSVNGKRVTNADVAADNGIIHFIDGVLIPPAGDVVAAVAGDLGSFSLLVQAVTRAGLASTLTSATAVTVFAPTNDAFIAAGFSASAIAAATPTALAKILTYHVVPGRVFSANLTDGATPPTLQGGTVKVGVTGSGVTVTGQGNGTNASTVTKANVLTTNAVVHYINRVLLPPP